VPVRSERPDIDRCEADGCHRDPLTLNRPATPDFIKKSAATVVNKVRIFSLIYDRCDIFARLQVTPPPAPPADRPGAWAVRLEPPARTGPGSRRVRAAAEKAVAEDSRSVASYVEKLLTDQPSKTGCI
jgi:hypothetical protein